jgi:tRNA-splicing ligase RtcB
MEEVKIKKVNSYVWEIPKHGDMLVPGRIYANKAIVDFLLDDVKQGKEWNALKQIINVACLPGIQKASLAMTDVHPGYGFPIGGVAAFDVKTGVISVAGVGFDINCGVRTLRTPLKKQDIEDKKEELAEKLFEVIPAGLGVKGKIRLTMDDIDELLIKGAEFSLGKGYGIKQDLEFIEENGKIKGAKPEYVSDKAKKRQLNGMGTLGSGNHYLEVQYVSEIYDEEVAKAYGLFKDQIVISIHCGSRSLGHQIGSDYLKTLEFASKKYKIPIREKELVCAPFTSEEGQRYYGAMNAGINCAFANRQILAHLARQVFASVFDIKEEEVETLYEVAHNTCKVEKHKIDGKLKDVIVHRKGATRAFGPGHPDIPKEYRKVGQPVLVGGTMGTSSYILSGTETAMKETFGTAIHGAGRFMSRHQAKRKWNGVDLIKELSKKGIIIKSRSPSGVAEEAPGAYKDVTEVVDVMHNSGVAKKVVQVKPLICVKG